MKREHDNKNMKLAVLGIFISALCFSTMEIALKIGGNSLDPIQMTFLRLFCFDSKLLFNFLPVVMVPLLDYT